MIEPFKRRPFFILNFETTNNQHVVLDVGVFIHLLMQVSVDGSKHVC